MRVITICLLISIVVAILTAEESFEMEMAKVRRSQITTNYERGEKR